VVQDTECRIGLMAGDHLRVKGNLSGPNRQNMFKGGEWIAIRGEYATAKEEREGNAATAALMRQRSRIEKFFFHEK